MNIGDGWKLAYLIKKCGYSKEQALEILLTENVTAACKSEDAMMFKAGWQAAIELIRLGKL